MAGPGRAESAAPALLRAAHQPAEHDLPLQIAEVVRHALQHAIPHDQLAALQRNQAATNEFLGMLTGSVPVSEFFAPKNLPQPILAKLSDAFRRAVEMPSVKEALTRAAFNVDYADGAVVQRNAESEFRVLRQLAEEGGFITK